MRFNTSPGSIAFLARCKGCVRVATASVALFSHLLCAGCDAYVGIEGTVVDESGAPVANASLFLDDPGQVTRKPSAVSRADGSFVISGSVAPDPAGSPVVLIVRAGGFKPHTEELDRNSVIEGHKVVLKRQSPPVKEKK